MKNFVLALLLLFYMGQLSAQNTSPREIVKKSLLKTTGGRKLESFRQVTTFDRTGTMAASFNERSPMSDLMESIMSTAPDSVKAQLTIEMKRANESIRQEVLSMYEKFSEVSYVDFRLKKMANIRTGIMGSDTSRTVQDLGNGKMAWAILRNPVLMLQYIAADSVELHYTGTTVIESEDQHIVQARIAGEWIELMIGKESRLLSRIVIPRVDTDPLIGRGPSITKTSIFSETTSKHPAFCCLRVWKNRARGSGRQSDLIWLGAISTSGSRIRLSPVSPRRRKKPHSNFQKLPRVCLSWN
ncbi:MAG: hypothetical protein ACO1N1_16600 [Dyadobacter fermentans]